jgi:large subunit ribosomal protein L16
MLSPKRTKFRKQHKGRIHGNAKGGTEVSFGAYGLKAMEPERITARQIEAARRAMTRKMRRVGKVWIRIFPDVPVSSKPAEVRMGKGKGTPEFWVARVKPGRIMFEMDGVPESLAREAFELAAAKLPIRTKFVTRPAYLPVREEVIYDAPPPLDDLEDEVDAAAEGDGDGDSEDVAAEAN